MICLVVTDIVCFCVKIITWSTHQTPPVEDRIEIPRIKQVDPKGAVKQTGLKLTGLLTTIGDLITDLIFNVSFENVNWWTSAGISAINSGTRNVELCLNWFWGNEKMTKGYWIGILVKDICISLHHHGQPIYEYRFVNTSNTREANTWIYGKWYINTFAFQKQCQVLARCC